MTLTLADLASCGQAAINGQPLPSPAAPGIEAAPELAILTRTKLAAPALPLDAFGPWWGPWIARAAAGANAPPDYVAMPLLAAASALIGNARWARAWHGWFEPPALWCASVGNPSSGKSPGAAPVMREVLGMVEADMARDHPAALERWKEAAEVAAIREKKWKDDVTKAVANGAPPPDKPSDAIAPARPECPRVRVKDTTVEALARILKGLPKGVMMERDELAGWLLNLSRYSGGNDRPFWLESYVGGSHKVDRQKHPEPIHLPRLVVAVFGTIQPDRLNDVLTETDDGLASRFLWAWPDPVPFRRPNGGGDASAATAALGKLAMLRMAEEEGEPKPVFVSLSPNAVALMERFGQDLQAKEAASYGVLKGSVGKARGQALRLALVLTFLWWCAGDGAPGTEPWQIEADAMNAAAGLIWHYFLPTAEQVLGDASVPPEERNGRTLAEWIARTRPKVVNVTAIRDKARLPGLRDTAAVKQACHYLADARWLIEADAPGTPGRRRGDWIINPLLWPAIGGRVV